MVTRTFRERNAFTGATQVRRWRMVVAAIATPFRGGCAAAVAVVVALLFVWPARHSRWSESRARWSISVLVEVVAGLFGG